MPKLIKTKVENEGRVTEEFAWVEEPRTTPWDVEQDLQVVGKPVALMLLEKHATVTICHSRTVSLRDEVGHADATMYWSWRAHSSVHWRFVSLRPVVRISSSSMKYRSRAAPGARRRCYGDVSIGND